uniref:Enoyl reductase (ER) domain-containing protein n=1 Tax=Timema poppense TaxID=170557 RepID=A0A7R9DFZ0_TIMPO|nr:unnamed protein product [Timema poppensis]
MDHNDDVDSPEDDNLEPALGINDVGHLEIAGVTDDGRRVMSVVQNNEDVSQKNLDTYLTWDIPDSWSLEDAATVPLAYATAYHCLIQTALLQSKQTVLIHAGHTSIGQAAIALALRIGSIVFTTVTELIHKEFLMKRFPQLQENKIFLSMRSSFAISLMRATKGLGAKVIMNCSRGTDLHISLQCMSQGGRFVQLETADMELNTNLGKWGLWNFFENVGGVGGSTQENTKPWMTLENDDTFLHNLDVASRSLDSLSYFVSLIDKSGEDISESRIKADLPILNVQWSHGIKVSNYEGLENMLPSNLQELEGVGLDFLSKPKSPFSLVPSLSSGIGYVPEVLPIFIVPGIKDSIKTFIEPLAKNILYPTICIDLQDHIVSLQDSATNIAKVSK